METSSRCAICRKAAGAKSAVKNFIQKSRVVSKGKPLGTDVVS
jgi:hypothetical protein